MFKANPNIIRSNYIGNIIKNVISDKGLTITEVANNVGITQPALSRALNGSVVGSDNLFLKIMKGTKLSDKKIKEIFKQADQEEYKYKYGEEIGEKGECIEDFDVALSREFGVSDEQALDDIKKMIRTFVKMKEDGDV